MATLLATNMFSFLSTHTIKGVKRLESKDKLQFRSKTAVPSSKGSSGRRHALVSAGTSLVTVTLLSPFLAWAEEKEPAQKEGDKGLIDAIKTLFDPHEETKSGKVLPKAYLKSAREVVKTLRDSLNEDPNDIAKFRRTADAAKESIREYLSNWKGQKAVVQEESYVELEKAIRSLANFYSKAGPSAPLSEEVKSEILVKSTIMNELRVEPDHLVMVLARLWNINQSYTIMQ